MLERFLPSEVVKERAFHNFMSTEATEKSIQTGSVNKEMLQMRAQST